MNKKIAVITSPRAPYSNYLNNKIKSLGYDCFYSLKGNYYNVFARFIRKIFFFKNLKHKTIFFDKWKRHLNEFDVFVVIRDRYGEYIAQYINKHSNAKVVLYFMDPYSKSVFLLNNYSHPNCIVSSFEKNLCIERGFLYNPLFCFKERISNENIKFDVFFVGTDKGRLGTLLLLEEKFKSLGISFYFHVVKSSGDSYKKTDDRNYRYKKKIPYYKILKYESISKCILDILPDGQRESTLRSVEAYFFKKKLITNNVNIINESFYNKQNVFVLGIDDEKLLIDFLNSTYIDKIDDEMEKCEFSKWINAYL